MSKNVGYNEYMTLEVVLLNRLGTSHLVRAGTHKKGWLRDGDTIEIQKIKNDPHFGTFKVTAQRWAFERAGLI